ncbi:MAG: hypothetical protein LC637_11605 [Xanthomonadaceae bacterium]|nr:hypothetical protein [Xanthomonadaceae bacterium]
MIDEFSRRVRFRQWLENTSSSGVSSYPRAEDLALDAKTFLDATDLLNRKKRETEAALSSLRSELMKRLEGLDADSDDEAILRALDREFKRRGSAGVRADSEQRKQLTAAREQVARLEAELKQEKRKLEHVLPYTYKLRVLHQRIIKDGQLTDARKKQVRELLRAGGVDVDT